MRRNPGVRGILRRRISWKPVGQEELDPQMPLSASVRQSAVLVAAPVHIQPAGKGEEGLLPLAAGVSVGTAGRVRASPYGSLAREPQCASDPRETRAPSPGRCRVILSQSPFRVRRCP